MLRKKLSVLIVLALILTGAIWCTSKIAAANTTAVQQNVFNEDKAKADSKKSLESFLNSHKNGEILINSTDKTELKNYVDKNFKKYFTSDFINYTDNDLDSGFSYEKYNLFYLNLDKNSMNFKNNYFIKTPTVNTKNKTVTYSFQERSGNAFLFSPPPVVTKDKTVVYFWEKSVGNRFFQIQMKLENEKWKINKVSQEQPK